MQGGRKLSQWNIFVKKIYAEGHAKNKAYSFKQALNDASKRKGEMGSMGSKNSRKSNKRRSRGLAGGSSEIIAVMAGGRRTRRRSIALTGGKK